MPTPAQDISHKLGEVRFRRKLFEQQVEGKQIFDDEFDAAGIEAVLADRMRETREALGALAARGLTLEPYLEIGAERGQRSLVMENELGRRGAALDLSLDLLRSCAHYAERFGSERLPMRICADVYRLPFRTGSLPFVFCYQTLHHFPALDPVVAEVHRVLAPGGHFFFAEEPYRRVAHLPLVRAKGGVSRAPRSRFRKLLRNVFVDERFNEEDFGVLENHDMSIAQWKSAMSIFESGQATLELDRFRVSATGRRNPAIYLMLWLLGGRIGGLYRKAGTLRDHASSIEEALIDPATAGNDHEEPLRQTNSGFAAPTGALYPVQDGIPLLLDPRTRHDLYPEAAGAVVEGGQQPEISSNKEEQQE